jgi:hypothetical protein
MSLLKTPTTKTELRNQWLIVAAAFAALVVLAFVLYCPVANATPIIQPDVLATGVQPELHARKLAPVATSRGEPIFILVTDRTDHPVTIGSVEKIYDTHDAFILMMDKCTGRTLYPNPLSCEIRYAYTAPNTKELGQTAVVMIRDTAGNEVGGTILMGRAAQQAGGAQ